MPTAHGISNAPRDPSLKGNFKRDFALWRNTKTANKEPLGYEVRDISGIVCKQVEYRFGEGV